MYIKLILTILLLIANVSGLSVSAILQDDVSVENDTIIHSVTAFRDVQNVTVRDYFYEVKVKGIDVGREKFLNKGWNSVRFDIGAMNSGYSRIITYEILSGNGTALLGADTYYLDGEFHQLFPKEVEIDIGNRTAGGDWNSVWIAIMVMIVLIIAYMLFR